MKNWRTTVGGVVSILGLVLPFFGVASPVAQAIQVVGLAILAWFSKDYTNTGVGV